MDAQQRFLRRKYLIENLEILLRESAYHRTNDDAEKLPGIEVWQWDQPEGAGDGIF